MSRRRDQCACRDHHQQCQDDDGEEHGRCWRLEGFLKDVDVGWHRTANREQDVWYVAS